jgi:hypothetical protein
MPFKSLLSISAIFGNTGDHGDSRHPPLPPYLHPFPPKVTQHDPRIGRGSQPDSGDYVAMSAIPAIRLPHPAISPSLLQTQHFIPIDPWVSLA